MPPKRKRVTPHQSEISVQDVRDYSTPDGAAMANEEMRRIQLKLKDLGSKVDDRAAGEATPVRGSTPGTTPTPNTPAANDYTWFVGAEEGSYAKVENGDEVLFTGVNGITVKRNGRVIYIYGKEEIWWTAVADVGNFKVFDEQVAKFTGINGVTTRASGPDSAIIINRPLQIQKRSVGIGLPDTTVLNFNNYTGVKPGGYTSRVYFDVVDYGNGQRNIEAYFELGGAGSYDWDFITDTAVAETISSGEQVSFLGTGIVDVTNVGNVITIHAPATLGWELQAVGTLGTETIDGGDTVVFDKGGDLTVGRTGNTITYSYTNPNPTPYHFNVQANGLASTQIDYNETLNFIEAGGGITITRSGNDFTFTVVPATYSFDLKAVGTVGAETITNGQDIIFDKGGDLTVNRAGDTITYSYTNPNPTVYTFDLKAVGTAGQETIGAGQDIIFDKGGDLTVNRVGETITYSYTNPNPTPYHFNVQANGLASTQIDYNETLNFIEAGGGITITRSGNDFTFTVVPATYSFDLKAVGTVGAETIANGQDIIFDKGGDLAVNRTGETITYSYTNPNPTPYHFNVQANGGTTEQIDYNETLNFVEAGGGITIVRSGNTLTFTVSTAGTYNWVASDGPNNSTINTTDEVTWTGASGVVVTLNTGTKTFEIDRPLQLKQEAVNVGADDTISIDFDNDTSLKPGGHTARVWTEVVDDGSGARRVIAWFDPGAGSYSWVASDGPNNSTVNSTDEVTWTGASGVIVTLNTGTKTFEIDRPLQIQQDGTPVGADDTITLNFDNDTGLKPAGHTGRIWTEVVDSGAGVRYTRMWYDPTGTVYGWNIAASGTGGSAAVVNGATVIFTGQNGIVVTRSGDDITIGMDQVDPPWGPGGAKRVMTGVIEFLPATADYLGSPPAYLYGTRLYVDIVHNWNLSNYNNFHLELIDKALSDDGTTLEQYRSGDNPMNGQPSFPNVRFRNFPHWAAVDANTIRVWATMSRLKPTKMQFRYVLEEK